MTLRSTIMNTISCWVLITSAAHHVWAGHPAGGGSKAVKVQIGTGHHHHHHHGHYPYGIRYSHPYGYSPKYVYGYSYGYPAYVYRPVIQVPTPSFGSPTVVVQSQVAPVQSTVIPAVATGIGAAPVAATGQVQVLQAQLPRVPAGGTLRITTDSLGGAPDKVLLRIKNRPQPIEVIAVEEDALVVKLPEFTTRKSLVGRLEVYSGPKTIHTAIEVEITPAVRDNDR